MEASIKASIITNEYLIQSYLTPAMEHYFHKKLPNENPIILRLKICELLKYFFLIVHSKGQIPFNEEIDILWHLWILQTKQYCELMEKLPTGQYIHHSSNDYSDTAIVSVKPNEDEEINRQISFLVSYVNNFGDFCDETILYWPMATSLMSAHNLKIDELNKYLKNLSLVS